MACAEHALYLSIACLRKQYEMNQSLMKGHIGVPTGRTLYQSNVMIYGFGNIGHELLNRLVAFQLKNIFVIHRSKNLNTTDIVNSSQSDDISTTTNIEYGTHDEKFDDFAQQTDIIFLCCSQNKENIGFVNKTLISKLKPNCIIINVARVS